MRRIIIPFLIITICSFGVIASGIENKVVERPDSIPMIDSLDLFRDITDISRQIERRTMQAKERIDSEIISPQQGTDTPPNPIITPPDTIIIPPVSNPVAKGTGSIIFEDSIPSFRNPLDSIYFRRENGTLQLPVNYNNVGSMNGLSFRDTLFYNPLFLPMIFTGEMLPRELSLYSEEKDRDKGVLIPREKTFAPRLDHIDFVRNVRRDYYMKYPDRIRYSVASFDSIPSLESDDQVVRETFNPFRELIKAETTYSLDAPGIEGVTIGRKYWVRSGEHSFQFAQNYFSDNWHKGGVNNLNINSLHILKANYQKKRVKFNNTLEWRLSVFNSPDDSLRKHRIGNDLIRYYGDFGIDAFGKGWSYSTNLEAKSQMFKAYPVNSNDLLSSILSPLYVNAGVGLKFNYERPSKTVRHRKIKWELAIAPVSINYVYVMNDDVDEKRFGIEEGKKSEFDFGSTITSILKYDITRYITWDSRLTYFTSYEKVISEFENSLNMALTNAFSTRLYVIMRFDDGVPPDPDLKYWQMNQTLSFGLNYKW
ncbi:DUF3078 domain-containing protein [Proteiniphilum saccharofermentans]|uniref:DUF3078 domain-containing protein n=1 Tax=Proteiniphilum saccharofermentans TaxID=1642647 RepID=UPI0028AA6D1C|nr:DUF3078 domain-containing protein [Proteiniphilum saccharofermentans]